MKRRQALISLGAMSSPWLHAADNTALTRLLIAGACAVMVRHAQTEPGVGDPANFRLGTCETQRNLSEQGRAQAIRLGQWFSANQLRPSRVRSSQWCRCRDTAQLAFGQQTELEALNSSFDHPGQQGPRTAALQALLQAIPAGQFEVWVTHQVNMTAMTGEWPATGEAFVVSAQGRLLGRQHFA
jgi:phosphohistidine phosphatase SixA